MLNNLGEIAEQCGDLPRAAALFTHSGRIFGDLHSALAAVPRQARARLEESLSPEEREALTRSAEATDWEELI
jgi:hypothetical protein